MTKRSGTQDIGKCGALSLDDFPDEDDFCRQCGGALPHDSWLGRRKFYDRKCQQRWQDNNPDLRASYGLNPCGTCGAIFHMRRPDSKFCSLKCFGASLKKPPDRLCSHCGESFKATKPRNKFCSRSCYEKATRLEARNCGWCGQTFSPAAITVHFCSKRCARLSYWKKWRDQCKAEL